MNIILTVEIRYSTKHFYQNKDYRSFENMKMNINNQVLQNLVHSSTISDFEIHIHKLNIKHRFLFNFKIIYSKQGKRKN